MLSAVDSFGPVPGPSAALTYAHHHHNTYAIAAIAAANAAVIPQNPLLHNIPSKSEELQQSHLIQQHIHQALIARPIAATPFVDSLANKFLKQNVALNDSEHINQLSPNYIPQTTINNNSLKRYKSKDDLEADMSINKFLQPNPKQQRFNCNSIPENQNSKNLYHQATGNSSNYYVNDDSGAMNLVTTGSNSSNSAHSQERNRSVSSSPVDIENDDSMSPLSIPITNRKPIDTSLDHKAAVDANNITTSGGVPTVYPFNYAHLYANGATIYNTPLVFATHQSHHQSQADIAATHGAYLNALQAHRSIETSDTNSFSAEYIKAAMAAGILNPAAQNHHLTQTHKNVQIPYKSNSNAPLFALAPTYTRSTKSPNSNNQRQKASESDLKTSNTTMAKYSTGTYLNDKVNTSTTETDANNYFKVPNGKEGSLKHRILTRPTNTEPTETPKTSVMRTYNTKTNFIKGSYIELANGVLRRVEDMRTEDFISCAERSQQHQLAESTVVKITTTPNSTVVIQFSYDKNRSKVDIEVSSDHPFFVYGQGWASCNPEKSLEAYGLKCQRLQVGDICISLTQRDQPNVSRPTKTATDHSASWISKSTRTTNANGYGMKHNSENYDLIARPDNLSLPKSAPINTLSQHHFVTHVANNDLYANPNQSTDPNEQTVDVISRKRRWSAPES